MINKIENIVDFIFKAFKWIVIIFVVAFSLIMYKSCSETFKTLEEAHSDIRK